MGTSYGLNSYDGTTIKSYTKEDNGLCHNYVHSIAEDGKGNLWIKSGDFGKQEFYFCILDPISQLIYSVEEYTGEPCPFDPNHTNLQANYKWAFLLQERLGNHIQFHEVQEARIEKGFSFFFC